VVHDVLELQLPNVEAVFAGSLSNRTPMNPLQQAMCWEIIAACRALCREVPIRTGNQERHLQVSS
jgi:hypothetical protein